MNRDQVTIYFNNRPITAYKGDTIAAALLRSGYLESTTTGFSQLGIYCNMGVCHSCIMVVNGIQSVRICRTFVSEGCHIQNKHAADRASEKV